MNKYKHINSSCGCTKDKDGIDTDLLHLLPSYIYELLKKRSRLKSKKFYNDKHKNWFKSRARRNNLNLRDYLFSISPEIQKHIEVIEIYQQGGTIPTDLNDIASSINDRIEEIYQNKVNFAQEGLDRVRLLNDNVEGTTFTKGFNKISDTGFVEVDSPSEMLETNSCYKIDKDSKPVKVDCSVEGAVTEEEFRKSQEGKRYFMREEVASKTTTTSKEGTTFGSNPQEPNKSDGKYFKKNCKKGCPNTESISIKELRSFIKPSFTSFIKKFLNGIINTALKNGGNEDTIVVIKHGGDDMLHAAMVGCFCAYNGEIAPSSKTKTEQERSVTVAEEDIPGKVKDNLSLDFVVEIPIISKIPDSIFKYSRKQQVAEGDETSFTNSAEDRQNVYVILSAKSNGKEYSNFVVKDISLKPFTGTLGIGLKSRTPTKSPRNMTPEESNSIFKNTGSKRDSSYLSYLKSIIPTVLNSPDMKSNLEKEIIPKFNEFSQNKSKEFKSEKEGEFKDKMQSGGLYQIGKERIFHKPNSGKEFNIQEYIKWKALKVDRRYLNQ